MSHPHARRRRAEWLMVDTCVIDRPERSMNWNPQTGRDEPAMTRVYEGKCRLRQQTSYGTAPTTGGHTYELQQTELHIPRGAQYEPHVGDVRLHRSIALALGDLRVAAGQQRGRGGRCGSLGRHRTARPSG